MLPEGRLRKLLIVLLSQNPDVHCRITDPALPLETALEILRLVTRADGEFLPKLINMLPRDNRTSNTNTLSGQRLLRAVMLLDAVGGASAIQAMRYLTLSGDERAASKAAISLGRWSQNVEWATGVLKRSKFARVRANVLESLWEGKSPPLLELYRSCLEDENNRVVGNAIVGLWLAGDPTVAERIIPELGRHDSSKHRQTAAWLIGRLVFADMRTTLEALLQDPHLPVRRAAIAALRKLKPASEAPVVESAAPAESRIDAPATADDLQIRFWIDGKQV
jgi:HEAT repeat protein